MIFSLRRSDQEHHVRRGRRHSSRTPGRARHAPKLGRRARPTAPRSTNGRELRLIAPGLEAVQVERRLDQLEQLRVGPPDALERVPAVGEVRVAEHVAVAGDDVERRPQLVRHGRDELELGAVRALELVDEPAQRLLARARRSAR